MNVAPSTASWVGPLGLTSICGFSNALHTLSRIRAENPRRGSYLRSEDATTESDLKTIGRALAGGIFVALLVALNSESADHSTLLRVLELVVIIVLGLIVLAAIVELITRGVAGWHESEEEFELIVQRSERLGQRPGG